MVQFIDKSVSAVSMDQAEIDLFVGQYLKERGYDVALLALTDSSSVTDAAVAALPAGRLREILDENYERKQAATAADPAVKELQLPELERAGDGHFARDLWCDLEQVHATNALTTRIHPDGKAVLSGAADKQIKLTAIPDDPDDASVAVSGSEVVQTCSGPVLCIDINPMNTDLVLAGDMAGGAVVFSLSSRKVVFSPERHRKYVVRVAWSSCGKFFATASYDNEARLYAARPEAGEEADAEAPYRLVHTVQGTGQVTSVAFTPSTVAPEDAELAVTVRDDHRVHLVSLSTLEPRTINLNANGDSWVSFTAMDVSFSPHGAFVLVSTDKERLILLSRQSGVQLRNFYGASNDEYSNPRHCWHPSGQYIYATSQLHEVLVWEVHSAKVVGKMSDHTAPIKDIYYDKGRKMLASTGFDKTVKLWREIL
eukprot:m.447846 g.447846  ORF g.447846 m.447846 type:complete len:426 (+) comp19570_c0_seq1:2116-3393(+)